MGFLKPKTVVMPAAAQTPVAETQVTPPPATIEDTYEVENEDGTTRTTTAETEAQRRIRRRQEGMSNTILTSTQGDTSNPNVYSATLLN
tara:strand:- start:442 stop:708 length:267 start_codon:yes stop_codon:yes gene_type:complete